MQILIGLSLCLFVALGVQTFRVGALKQEAAEQKAALATATAAAEKEARTRELEMADSARKAAGIYAQQINKVRGDADGARSELARLRDALGTPRDAAQDAAAAVGADDASRARAVVGRCAAVVQRMAEVADTCESRLTGLQDWAKAVTQ